MFRKRVIILFVIAVCVGVVVWMLPPVGRAIGRWRGHKTCTLRGIGLALFQYAGDHDDKFPESFGVLLKEGYVTVPRVFVNPYSGSKVPADFPGYEHLKDADLATLNRVHDFGDYALARGVSHAEDWDAIVVYEKRVIYRGTRGCFFNDGHTQWIPEAEFQKRLKAQQAKMREVPEKVVE